MLPTPSPFYLKATISMLGLTLLGFIIFIGQDILVPIAFSVLLSILLLPVTNWLERRRLGRITAIIFSIFVSLIIIYKPDLKRLELPTS